ncbi:MAG: hypothetical protein HOD49_19835, partial [Anaerolineae bacterium]|nr:hypothetical protein [Anaerolineae bacterium]
EIACRVEKGEVSTTVAFEIAAYLTPESQRELAQEEKITGGLVHKYRSAGREQKELNGLQVIEQPKSATMDEILGELSVDTLQAIMADLPTGQHFAIWRAKVARAMSLLSVELSVELPVDVVM